MIAMTGAIIAAGEGRRLREGGFPMPKPMVPVAGVPLLGSAIERFAGAGIQPVIVIVNEGERECVGWARARFPALDLRFLVESTASSLVSFQRVLAASPGPRVLVSTVDAWCRPGSFAAFAAAAARHPEEATVLAVTPLVADEKPLWVSLGPGRQVRQLGGAGGDLVTAGLYLVPDRVRRARPPAGLRRLRDYLAWLVAEGEPLFAEIIQNAVDVDRPEDVALAEVLAQEPWPDQEVRT